MPEPDDTCCNIRAPLAAVTAEGDGVKAGHEALLGLRDHLRDLARATRGEEQALLHQARIEVGDIIENVLVAGWPGLQ